MAGICVCDGGMLIDLSRMKEMRVDPVARTIRVEAGLTWGEVNHELQVFGLAATGGFVSTAGLSQCGCQSNVKERDAVHPISTLRRLCARSQQKDSNPNTVVARAGKLASVRSDSNA